MVLVLCTHKQSAHKCRDWIISEEKYIQDGEEEDEDAVLELPHKRVMLLGGSLPCTCCATATEFFLLLHLLLLFASPDRIAQEHRVARLLSSFCFVFFFFFFFNLLLLIFFLRALFVKLKRDDWGQKTRQLFFFSWRLSHRSWGFLFLFSTPSHLFPATVQRTPPFKTYCTLSGHTRERYRGRKRWVWTTRTKKEGERSDRIML